MTRPAITGGSGRTWYLAPLTALVLGALMLLALRLASRRASTPPATAPGAKARPKTAGQLGREAFANHAGWFGATRTEDGAVVTLVSIPADDPVARDALPGLAGRFSLAVLSVDNSAGTAQVSIDTDRVTLHLAGGGTRAAMPVRPLLREMPSESDRAEGLRLYAPPFDVPFGQRLNGKPVFFPPATDFASVERVTVRVNGQPLDLPGRYLTVQQKSELLRRGVEQPRER